MHDARSGLVWVGKHYSPLARRGAQGGPTINRLARKLGLATLLLLVFAQPAFAVDPETAVGGNGSKWFSGSGLQMAGENCVVLGNPYTEIMVNATAEYGGAPGGGVVQVGDRYYIGVLISIPGDPCGSGSSNVVTDVFLPRGVSEDTSAPIRCFGQPKSASSPGEITGGTWSFMGYSGKYCPDHLGPTQTGAPYTHGAGYRPLANGTLFWLFVPVKSNQTLEGAGHSPPDEFHWFISASGTYESPQASSVWANVFPGGSGGTPFVYFARNPSVEPYWDKSAPSGQENKAEWFANLYSAGYAGNLCYELYDGDPPTGSPTDCTADSGWNGAVPGGGDLFQVHATGVNAGPNGGYVPFYYTIPNHTYTLRWTFTYDPGGGNTTVHKDIVWKTLAGPDNDGDGVPDASDACPTKKGTQPNGCLPPTKTDPDGDGVYGSADKCPTKNGGVSPDGCPKAGPPTFTASLGAIKGNKLKRKKLAKKGVSLSLRCSQASKASATLNLSRKVAKKLKIKVKRGQQLVTVGAGSANCTPPGGTLKLKLKRSFKRKVRKPRKAVKATLIVVFTRAGSKPVTVQSALKLT